MLSRATYLTTAFALFWAASASAAVIHYVDLNSPGPVPPYTSWATAATNIQNALDAASAGDTVLVTNGVYNYGTNITTDGFKNRVVLSNALTLQSVNGPAFTAIDGTGTMRCAYLTNGAVLSGFTLTNGSVNGSGGGVYCVSTNAILSNCTLVKNNSHGGGGAYSGTLYGCLLSSNIADSGGGAYNSTLVGCAICGNMGNPLPTGSGGGVFGCKLYSCTVTSNSVRDSMINGASSGGGAESSTLANCIVLYNAARIGANSDNCTFNFCCTSPMPSGGTGNITNEPQLADAFHLSAGSPCIAAGSTAYASGTDIDGEAWANPPAIGCDEYHPGSITGPMTVAILPPQFTNFAPGYQLKLTARLIGRISANRWDFGDGTIVSNRPFASHSWAAVGDYSVVFTAFNESNPAGVSPAAVTVHVAQSQQFVATNSSNPLPPFTSWATAATNIQDAVNYAKPGGTITVTNGVYTNGARIVPFGFEESNYARVSASDFPLNIRSVNGPSVTVIRGIQANAPLGVPFRCVYLSADSTLAGFTLTNGGTLKATGSTDLISSGGGVLCYSASDVVSNCVIAGNVALFGAGAAYGTLIDCTIVNNTAATNGGGASFSDLNNCLIAGNSAMYGGGIAFSTVRNCTIISNTAATNGGGTYFGSLLNSIVLYNNFVTGTGSNYYFSSNTFYCCTLPLASGPGNITNLPLFINLAGGDYHLLSNSPCVNAGNNLYAAAGPDYDGNPRVSGGTVDIGAYEYQNPASVISYAWLQQYGLVTDGSADFLDPDHDGLNNWQEWRAGTNPTNASSFLSLSNPIRSGSNIVISWQSANNVTYYLQRSLGLGSPPVFQPLATNIAGHANTTSYTDTNAAGLAPLYYRVGVQ